MRTKKNRFCRLFYEHPGSFRRKLTNRKFWIVLALLLPLSDWLGKNVMFDPAAKWYFDWLLRQRDKQQEHFTRIVRIGPEDHERIFNSRSPLNSPALYESVCALLRRGPAVVVVDIDTSNDKEYKGFRVPTSGNVVWARDLVQIPSGSGRRFAADPVLGGYLEPVYGIATMPADFDGRVRRWARFVAIDDTLRPTLIWRAVQEYCTGSFRPGCPAPRELNSAREASFELSRDVVFQTLELSEFLPGRSQSMAKDCTERIPDPRLKNRIVLLGGFYSREDLHDTPWGKRTGAELIAMAIEHELEPRPLHHLTLPLKWGVKILIAFAIAFIHHRLRPLSAAVGTLCLLPLVILVSGYLAFYLGDSDLAATPFLIGILIEQLGTGAEQAEHVAQRLEQLIQKNRRVAVQPRNGGK